MYHRVIDSPGEGLSISIEDLRAQFTFLIAQGYRSWHFSELLEQTRLPNGRHVVITFDDATVDHAEKVYPLLVELGLKATFFVPMGFLGKQDDWNQGAMPIMDADALGRLDPEVVELGYHSFAHGRYDEMSLQEVAADLVLARDEAREKGFELSPVLAYPYGKYPRSGGQHLDFCEMLRQAGINLGLRIGNRVNRYPFPKPYEVQRLDIKGEYDLKQFQKKLRKGKSWW